MIKWIRGVSRGFLTSHDQEAKGSDRKWEQVLSPRPTPSDLALAPRPCPRVAQHTLKNSTPNLKHMFKHMSPIRDISHSNHNMAEGSYWVIKKKISEFEHAGSARETCGIPPTSKDWGEILHHDDLFHFLFLSGPANSSLWKARG